MQYFSENCCILWIRHAVISKVQGTVKVWKLKDVRTLNSTPILICNPGRALGPVPGRGRRRARGLAVARLGLLRGGHGERAVRLHGLALLGPRFLRAGARANGLRLSWKLRYRILLRNFQPNDRSLEGSFSAVSAPISASKYSFCSICRDLQDCHTFAPLETENLNKDS